MYPPHDNQSRTLLRRIEIINHNSEVINILAIVKAANVDAFFRNNRYSIGNPDLIRGIISPLLVSITTKASVHPKKLNKALTDLRKNDSIKIMPADKRRKVVLLDTDDYKRKNFGYPKR